MGAATTLISPMSVRAGGNVSTNGVCYLMNSDCCVDTRECLEFGDFIMPEPSEVHAAMESGLDSKNILAVRNQLFIPLSCLSDDSFLICQPDMDIVFSERVEEIHPKTLIKANFREGVIVNSAASIGVHTPSISGQENTRHFH